MSSSLSSSRPAVVAAAVAGTACIVLLTYRHYKNSTISDNDNEGSNCTCRSQPVTPNSKKKNKKRKRKRKKKKSTSPRNDAALEAEIDPGTFQFPENPCCPICSVPLPFRQSQKTFLLCCGKEICRACNAEAYVAGYGDARDPRSGITDIDDDDDPDYKVACCKFCARTAPGEHDILNLLKERADNGDTNALHIIAGMYMDGNGVQKDEALAVELCQQASDGNNAEAAHEMAVICSQGRYQGSYRFVEQDVSRAKRLLAKAARLGSIKSLTLLGNITASEGNAELAVMYWRIAASAGDAFALETYKNAFASGVTSKEDYATALRGYQSAQASTRSEKRDRFEKELVAMNSPPDTFVESS